VKVKWVDAARAAFSLKRRRIHLQSETRTPWQAPKVYIKISPFMYADKIKAPLLPIRGEAGGNSGTFPIQSDRMYQAVRGNRGKETIEHVLWEKFAWFDKYVKNAGAAAPGN
jgi:dipeptidyl aminopeptidase/acylaminoacyl peptidase